MIKSKIGEFFRPSGDFVASFQVIGKEIKILTLGNNLTDREKELLENLKKIHFNTSVDMNVNDFVDGLIEAFKEDWE